MASYNKVILMGHVDFCYVPALIAGRGFQMFYVHKNPELRDLLVERANEFFEKYVEPVVPPPSTVPSLDVINRIIHKQGTRVVVAFEIGKTWVDAKSELEAAEKRKKEAEAALKAALSGADEGMFTLPDINEQCVAAKCSIIREDMTVLVPCEEFGQCPRSIGAVTQYAVPHGAEEKPRKAYVAYPLLHRKKGLK